jgi:hypothetical protein
MNDEVAYCYAALLDVLGYRSRLDQDRDTGQLAFRDQLQRALGVLGTINEALYSYSAISDTIILTCSSRREVLGFLGALKLVFVAFLKEGLLIRGAATYGAHFKSSHVTYSHAIARAYQLEQESAIYPRIVVDPNVVEMFRSNGELATLTSSRLICQSNNTHFLNVVDEDNWQTVYGAARKLFLETQRSLARNERAFMKHAWLEGYLFSSPFADTTQQRYIPGILELDGRPDGAS